MDNPFNFPVTTQALQTLISNQAAIQGAPLGQNTAPPPLVQSPNSAFTAMNPGVGALPFQWMGQNIATSSSGGLVNVNGGGGIGGITGHPVNPLPVPGALAHHMQGWFWAQYANLIPHSTIMTPAETPSSTQCLSVSPESSPMVSATPGIPQTQLFQATPGIPMPPLLSAFTQMRPNTLGFGYENRQVQNTYTTKKKYSSSCRQKIEVAPLKTSPKLHITDEDLNEAVIVHTFFGLAKESIKFFIYHGVRRTTLREWTGTSLTDLENIVTKAGIKMVSDEEREKAKTILQLFLAVIFFREAFEDIIYPARNRDGLSFYDNHVLAGDIKKRSRKRVAYFGPQESAIFRHPWRPRALRAAKNVETDQDVLRLNEQLQKNLVFEARPLPANPAPTSLFYWSPSWNF